MAITQNLYTGNGSTTNYSFTFPYLEETDVKVSLDGVATTAYSFANATTIQFDAAPADGTAIRIYRQTDDSELSATFYSGSAIRANDLNDNFTQNLYVTQEIANNSVLTDGSNPMVGNLDMGGYGIINLGDPSAGSHAVNKDYVDIRTGSLSIPGFTRWTYNAVGGETTLSGAGTTGGTLAYSAGREQVFLNGAQQQRGIDYTADNGTSVVFNVALTAGDVVEVICVNNLNTGTTAQAQDVSFVQSGAGAVTRSVENKLRDVVSVKDFGAVGDGVTDDTAAIQAAVNASSGGQGAVYIPDGVYRLTTGLTIPDDGITIYGDGFGRSFSAYKNTGTRLLADFTTGWVITCEHPCFSLRDIEIYGSDATRWASAGSVNGTKGAIYLRDSVTCLLERVLIYQEPGIGIYLSRDCPSSKLTQVTVEYCKGHAYYVDDGALVDSSGYVPCGIITFDSCRAARVDCCAFFAGNPANESGIVLAAYRLYLLNCEFFFCGGNTALSSNANYVIRLYADNSIIVGSAVSSPNGQAGGNSPTQGVLSSDGATVAALVRGIYVDGRNNQLVNNRFIRVATQGINIAGTATNTVVNGAEFRHTNGINFDPAINVVSGADGITVSNIGLPQVDDPINFTLADAASSVNPFISATSEGIYAFVNGDGVYLDPAVGTFSCFDGTTQRHRFGFDGTYRAFAEVRPIANNTASLGIGGARWSEVFAVNGTINTSDANYKQQIQEIPEAVLRAWGNVNFKQYKFNHAVESKGDQARWHHGAIAQEVKSAFESEGLDPFAYGLLCYDSWEDEYDDEGNILNPAGSSYGIRYEEALALECAYLRWRLNTL